MAKVMGMGDCVVLPWLRLGNLTARASDSIPGQGINILQAAGTAKEIKVKRCDISD